MLISGVQEGGREKRTFFLEHTHDKEVLWERFVMTGLYSPIGVATRQVVGDCRVESKRKPNHRLLAILNCVIFLLEHLFLSALKVTFVAEKETTHFAEENLDF